MSDDPERPSPGAADEGEASDGGVSDRARLAEDLPRPVYDFLLELSATLKNFAMYPGGHPSLDAKLESLMGRVRSLLSSKSRVTVSVGREYLMVGSARTDASNPLLSSVAERLHGHHILAVDLRRGVQPEELRELLSALGREPDEGDTRPLGLRLRDRQSPWPHIHIQPLDYDPIELAEEQEGESFEDRLLEEADLPFSTEVAGSDLRSDSPSTIARRLERRLGEDDDPQNRMVAVEIFRLTENLATAGGEVGDALRDRMSDLVTELEPETVARLLGIGEAGGRREEFIRTGASWMDLDAVVRVFEAAVDQDGADHGESLLKLVSKLSGYAPSDGEPYDREPDGAVRDLAHELVEGWELEDPRPEPYASALDELNLGPVPVQEEVDLDIRPEPERTVKTGIELNEASVSVRRSVATLLAQEEAESLLDLMSEAPEENETADFVWERLSTPESFAQLVRADPPNFEVLDRILEELGLEVADAMIEVFVEADERSVRWELFDRLVGLGPELAPRVADHLEDAERWYVIRNLLSLLVELETVPEGVDLDAYLADDERRIRTEAFKLAARLPGRRERAICTALRDPDDRLVRLALAAAEESCPPAAESFVASILQDADRSDDLRASAARALADRGSERARKVLTDHCLRRRWFFWTRLADKSPDVLSALSGLAARWPDHPDARDVLERARGSDDSEIREAARVEEPAESEAKP